MNFSGIGTVANAVAIVIGTLLGVIIRKGLPEKIEKIMMDGVGLCVVVIGMQMALKSLNLVICIGSIVIGGIIGELLDVNGAFNRLGEWAGDKLAGGDKSAGAKIADGFVTASLLFCPGAMAVVGSIQDGLIGDPSTLYAKSMLDGITSIIFTANLGWGVALSAFSVGIYQGVITLFAGVFEPIATPAVLAEITSTGGVMILGIGLNLLHITKIKIANLMPALIPAVILAYFLG